MKIKKTLIGLFLLLIWVYACYYIHNTKVVVIDKAYLINLDRSKDRLEHMEKELANISLPVKYTRFKAIEGAKVKLTSLEDNKEYYPDYIIKNYPYLPEKFKVNCYQGEEFFLGPMTFSFDVNYHHYTIFPGILGCACSHKKIWEEMVKNNYNYVLVMEDDISFISKFDKYYNILLTNVPKDADFLFLNASDAKSYKTFGARYLNPYWKKVNKLITSTKSYIISLNAAKKLLEHNHLFMKNFIGIDLTISSLIESKLISAYVANPQLSYEFYQLGKNSSIGSEK